MIQQRIYPSSINLKAIDRAAEMLRGGGLVVYPTDTRYAVGCSALNKQAVDKLCRLKNLNPERNALSIICADISQASRYVHIGNDVFQILRAYCPGPYTFILQAAPTLPRIFRGRKQVGLRIPGNPITRALAESLGSPILTTSLAVPDAVPGDEVSSQSVEPLAEALGVDMMIDGGCAVERLSTVVDLTDADNPEVIRAGTAPF